MTRAEVVLADYTDQGLVPLECTHRVTGAVLVGRLGADRNRQRGVFTDVAVGEVHEVDLGLVPAGAQVDWHLSGLCHRVALQHATIDFRVCLVTVAIA